MQDLTSIHTEMTYPLYPNGPDCQLWDLHSGFQPDVDVSVFDVLVHAEYVPPVLVTLLLQKTEIFLKIFTWQKTLGFGTGETIWKT